jgi:mannosyltransferase
VRPAVAAASPSAPVAGTSASAAAPVALALAAVCALAAAIRFSTLDVQSFWLDEGIAIGLIRRPFGDMLSTLPHGDSSPPLYYVLAWGWSRIFGSGEEGLRSLSALLGTLTVPTAYLAARELASQRVGLIVAALAAVNPWLVWYSQEARPYALLALLLTAGLVFFARSLGRGATRDLALWASLSILALATHYMAVFLIAAEAAWLLAAAPSSRRAKLAAMSAVAVAGGALMVLALEQRTTGGQDWVGDAPLRARLGDLPKKVVNGELGGAFDKQAGVGWLLLLVGAGLLVARGGARERSGAIIAASLAAACVALPLALALAGLDYLFARYAIGGLVPVLVVAAAGFETSRAGLAAALALGAMWVATDVRAVTDRGLQRDDWRGAVAALGPARELRAVAVPRDFDTTPLTVYLRGAAPLPDGGAAVRDLAVIRLVRGGDPPPLRIPGFVAVARRRATSYELLRFRAPVATRVTPDSLTTLGADPGVVLQLP